MESHKTTGSRVRNLGQSGRRLLFTDRDRKDFAFSLAVEACFRRHSA